MSVASDVRLALSNGAKKASPQIPSPEEQKESVERTLSCSSESSDVSLTSEEFRRIHQENDISLDLGSEEDNVADIFGYIEPLNHEEVFDETTLNRDNSLTIEDYPVSSPFWSCDPSVGVTLRIGSSGAAAETPETILDVFHRTVGENGDKLALSVKRAGRWKQWTYQKFYEECITVAKAFIKLGLEPYHGVCILGFNAPEWHVANFAAQMAGGIPVGLYITSTAETCCFIADSCKANIIVVENDLQLLKILEIRPRLTHLKAIIFYSKIFTNQEEGVIEWNEMKKLSYRHDDDTDEELKKRMHQIAPNKCALLIYTSGTTGHSKGVMISHDNITWMCRRILEETKATLGMERVISYLPLSHIAAQLMDIYFPLSAAASCWFAQPDALKGSLLQTLREVHPTIFLGVPRVWEKIAESMQLIARNTKGIKSHISQWAKGIGLKGNLQKQMGGSGTPFGWSLANAIFFKKVRKSLGLDQCYFPITGSAPISQDTLTYFMSVNIPIHEIYGMSETTGPTTVTTVENIRFRSSGRPFNGTELKIHKPDEAGNGEVYIRGRHLFIGYIGDPQATHNTITEDGWLKSGDIGYLSHEGFLYITGRTKELIILASGDKIAPIPIELAIKEELPIVSNVILVGDQRKFLSCLISFKVEFDDITHYPTERLSPTAIAICRSHGSMAETVSDISKGKGDHRILQMIQKGIDKVNKGASCKDHKIVKWSILDRDFSIQTGELTPTMKLKRKTIALKYADMIESLYLSQ